MVLHPIRVHHMLHLPDDRAGSLVSEPCVVHTALRMTQLCTCDMSWSTACQGAVQDCPGHDRHQLSAMGNGAWVHVHSLPALLCSLRQGLLLPQGSSHHRHSPQGVEPQSRS
jgi:hypothetical protein